MNRTTSICAVILAAGESTRMGRDKALLPWPPSERGGSDTFLSAAIRTLRPYSDMVIVVAGKNEQSLAPIVYANGVSLVKNLQPERGQFSSLQVGLQEVLNHGRDAAMVTLVDRPPVRETTIALLLSEFDTAVSQGKWAVVPELGGRHGHPILIGRDMIEAFLKAPVESSARDVEHQHQEHIEYLPVDDPSVTLNVDTPEDYAGLSSRG